jgi:hypothetical protein
MDRVWAAGQDMWRRVVRWSEGVSVCIGGGVRRMCVKTGECVGSGIVKWHALGVSRRIRLKVVGGWEGDHAEEAWLMIKIVCIRCDGGREDTLSP